MTPDELDKLWFKATQIAPMKGSVVRYEFAAFVAAAEREACAKLCKNKEAELLYKEGQTLPRGEPMLLKMASVANYCAAAIRARGNK